MNWRSANSRPFESWAILRNNGPERKKNRLIELVIFLIKLLCRSAYHSMWSQPSILVAPTSTHFINSCELLRSQSPTSRTCSFSKPEEQGGRGDSLARATAEYILGIEINLPSPEAPTGLSSNQASSVAVGRTAYWWA